MKNDFKTNTKKRNIIIALMIALIVIFSGITVGFALYRNNNEPADDPVVEVTAIKTADKVVNEITEETTSEITEEVTEVTTVESTEEVTTEETTESTTEMTTESTTEATTEATTESTTEMTTESTTEATTESTTEMTTEATTESTTEEIVPTHNHNYTSKKTAKPTCTKTGTITHTCSCGASYTTSIDATGHDFGSNNKTCANCGTANPNYEAPHTHSWVDKTWIETVHHDGEIVTLHKCYDCDVTGTLAEVKAHQKTTGYNGEHAHQGSHSIGDEERGGSDEEIPHNYKECSCGKRTGDVPK